jgi:predicted nucleic acid-binding protein
MPAVSNTSPVFNLAAIGHLALLKQQFGQIMIPPAVKAELEPVAHLPAAAQIQRAITESWLQIVPVQNHEAVANLRLDLDHGESEALILARELGLDRILLDERDARRIARQRALKPIGVLGILLHAKRAGSLESLEDEMTSLRERAGFYIGEGLFRQMLLEAGELR